MTADFRSLLSKPMDDIVKPKPIPAGTYQGIIKAIKFDESAKKKTPFVRFTVGLQSASDDISEEDLTEALAGAELQKKELSKDFYLTDTSLYRLKDFLESLGISTEGRVLAECIPEAQNAQVLIEVTHRNSEDGKDIFNDVGNLRGIDAE
jgi:hypothetical protein